jgi:hypothetical protein
MPFLLLAPPVMGAIFDRTDAYDDGFIMYICLGLAALLMVPRFRVIAMPRPALVPAG